ncbi:hypothetical protein BU23DRAFT_566930 [Bimuria novae-zelandiae CBS 107.79]|uniref:Uncharacterized protein n=1 Tax=Bimuria novae-zelandiae CBS 107.79 TaxID=1447943 RepID=A0A6A5VE32_9PLEO|nr:hypothetical protein BU23DRAFT_566930 [Bimuria novae-zelandiae CBS 107.79]
MFVARSVGLSVLPAIVEQPTHQGVPVGGLSAPTHALIKCLKVYLTRRSILITASIFCARESRRAEQGLGAKELFSFSSSSSLTSSSSPSSPSLTPTSLSLLPSLSPSPFKSPTLLASEGLSISSTEPTCEIFDDRGVRGVNRGSDRGLD